MDEHTYRLHMDSLVCDCHSDSLLRVMKGATLNSSDGQGHMDFPRMREGGIDMEIFACWIDPELPESKYLEYLLVMIQRFHEEIEASDGDVLHVKTPSDVRRAKSEGKLAAMLAIEGGHSINNNPDLIRIAYRLGVRLMTLTWNNSLSWADSSLEPRENGGLTDLGRRIIAEMNDLGMIIDVSHASDKTFWDAIETSRKPIIASHSCARALCSHPRNMSDEMIRALADKGGAVFVNFYPKFLVDPGSDGKLPKTDAGTIVDHIEHIADLVGVDHVGLGSDFDGVSYLPEGMEDCTRMPQITDLLIERGYSDEEVKKVLGENFLRIFEEVCG